MFDLPAVITLFFCLGYLLIIIENLVQINKAASALFMGVICWLLYFIFDPLPYEQKIDIINHHFSNIGQIIFFLMGALLIVEVIDQHHGFETIGELLSVRSLLLLTWLVLLCSFFLSAVLDNLTTMVVMLSLLRRMLPNHPYRQLLGGAIVIAVNAGGAWTPIGDVTTTMLWIGNRVSTTGIIQALFIPSFASLLALGASLSYFCPKTKEVRTKVIRPPKPFGSGIVLITGLLALFLVPTLKVFFGLPPYMGMLLGVAILWTLTDLTHRNEREHLKVFNILGKIDMSSVLFFLGILLAVDALDAVGTLSHLASYLDASFQSQEVVAVLIGIFSSIVDNVPLVAATMHMYSFPTDHSFWNLIAFCAGTGGSLLIIGSAPGVAFMSLEKVSFGWYLKNVSLLALLSYAVGIGVYMATAS